MAFFFDFFCFCFGYIFFVTLADSISLEGGFAGVREAHN